MKEQVSMDKRILAGLIDIGIAVVAAGILIGVAAVFSGKGILYYSILFPILYFFYMTVMDLVHNGQTVGRIVMHQQVVGKNDKMPSAVDFVVRNIVKTMPVLIIVLFPGIWLITFTSAGIYFLIPFVHSKHLAIHDIVGATVVDSDRPKEEVEVVSKNEEVPCGEIGKPAMDVVLEAEMPSPGEVIEQQDKAQAQPGIWGISGMYEGAFLPLTRAVVMGRSHTCNLVFQEDAPRISRRHCSVTCNMNDGTYILTDLQSSYGTFLADGFKIPAGKSVLLKEGEEFSIGQNERFRVGRKS